MAELEKALTGLEHCMRESDNLYDDPCNGCPYYVEKQPSGICSGELQKDCYDLLKKQTPIEPEYFMDGLVKRCRCKKCGKHIMSVGKYRDNYCAKCGQAVKWE